MTMFKVCWKNEYVVVVVAVVVVVVSIQGRPNAPPATQGKRAECRTHFQAECRQGGMPKQEGPEMKACSRQKSSDYSLRSCW